MKTRAALLHRPGEPLEVRELDVAEPRAREVVVRVAAVGVCGTDLHILSGDWPRPTPIVPGHEGAGVVETVGEGVESLAPGDEVVLSWAPACGECEACRRGRPAACVPLQRAMGNGTLLDGSTGLSLAGQTVYRAVATGALAERVVVAERAALKTNGAVPPAEAALLGCAALTGVGAVLFAARPDPGASVLVVGAGGVGQFAVQGARIAGAREIVCADPNEARLEQARELGATRTTTPGGLKATMRELLPDGADFAFDAVGVPETSALALRWTRGGGTCVLVGMPAAGARLDLDPFEFSGREKTLKGTVYGSEDPARALPVLLEHVRAGDLRLTGLVGPRFPLDAVNEAVAAAVGGVPGRVLVTP